MPTILNRSLAAILLFACSPLLLLTALAVLIALGRPLIFVQTRAGQGGRPFGLIKFRTMTDRRDRSGRLLPDAERTPRTGLVLRRTRLDDLLGLLNVVKGDLAIVGPRPLLPETIARLGSAGERRSAVLPGITGWAQVNGNTLLSDDQKVAFDLWYVEHRSWRIDAAIVLRTIDVLLRGERMSAKRQPQAAESGSP
ncbi:sugar transferase [Sphingomonas koreensis]|nr:sugar transferase [Sphingomonas koreensis]